MGVRDLQAFLESPSLDGGSVSVDLLKIARSVSQRQQPHNANRKIRPIGNKLKLIVDAENCLDRLYGGFFSDWACGGQWNRMVQFLSLLVSAIDRGNIELAVVFNGTIEQCRMDEWLAEQANVRQKVGMVLKHINTKATPPPKIWWTAPTCLRSALRMALRHLGVTVMCTMDDHHQEVIAYCREYGFHGLLADDAEYAAFDPPRYFSAQHLKLTYKGSIETKEYMLSVLTKTLNITQEQLCIMAALLGNFLLPERDLADFYKKIKLIRSTAENSFEQNVKTLAAFVHNLPPPSDMDGLVKAVFGSLEDRRASRFRQSVQYYLNGTASGFLKYCAPVKPRQNKNNANKQNHIKDENNSNANSQTNKTEAVSPPKEDIDLDTSGFASETTEQEKEGLENYKLVMSNSVTPAFNGIDPNLFKTIADDSSVSSEQSKLNGVSNSSTLKSSESSPTDPKVNTSVSSGVSSDSHTSSSSTSPKQPQQKARSAKSSSVTPSVSADVLRTASLRHQKGLMAPLVLHVLGTQEVRLPCLMEDESNREFPPIHDIYQPLRQRVYAVLFNLHHLRYVHTQKKENGEIPENSPAPDIVVKEWVYSRSNPYQRPEEVKADPVPWAVPTLQRLWFGPSLDDKRRRMRALLSIMNSDAPLMLNTAYVPQHMLIMACVLRYIMSQPWPILRRNELDAFLCQAINPSLMNPQFLQELTLNVVSSRGVQLASLFMQGVDMAMLANDACGAPLPWLMCCPWLHFDGKLFHYTLARSSHAKSILEVCDNYIERVVKVERMRKAILEGLDVKFVKMPLPQFAGAPMLRAGLPPPHLLAALPLASTRTGVRGRPIPSRGGQLQVAGVVVGSWGANYGFQTNVRQNQILPAGYTYTAQGRGRGFSGHYGRGRGPRKSGPPSYPVGNKRNQSNKKRNSNKSNKEKNPKGPSLTVKTDSGDVPLTDVVIKEDGTSSALGGKQEDCKPTVDHKGQGDAPNTVEAVAV